MAMDKGTTTEWKVIKIQNSKLWKDVQIKKWYGGGNRTFNKEPKKSVNQQMSVFHLHKVSLIVW